MRILALYPFLPYPADAGSKLRGASVLEILLTGHEVAFASLLANEDAATEITAWDMYSRFAGEPLTVSRVVKEELTAEGSALRAKRPKPKLGMPHWMDYFDLPGMWNRLAALDLQSIDAVHVRYVSMTPYALALKQAAPHLRLVVDLDDILSTVFYRKLEWPKKPSQAGMFSWHAREIMKMFAFENGPLRQFDSVWVCSQTDLRKISLRCGAQRSLIVANVVNADKLALVRREPTRPVLLFVGDFNYFPNSQAAAFFVSKVWPAIRAKIPDAELWLVGSNRQAEMLAWNGKDGIAVTGRVDSVAPYLEQAMVSIAPLLVGVGTRLKILEALGVGLPVVTTTIGVEGIDARNGTDLLIADTAEDFAAQCIRLLTDEALRDRLTSAGKVLVKERYDIAVMARAVLGCYDRLAEGSRP